VVAVVMEPVVLFVQLLVELAVVQPVLVAPEWELAQEVV